MKASTLPVPYEEVARAAAPVDDSRLPEWRPLDTAVVLLRRGYRNGDRSRFLRVDYDAGKAGWAAGGDALRLHLTAFRLDPVSKADREVLVEETVALGAGLDGAHVVEFASPALPASTESAVPTVPADWIDELFTDPLNGRCTPVRLALRIQDRTGSSDPPGQATPYQVVLNIAQLRNRRNVRQCVTSMGPAKQVVSLFYTNPDSQGLGVLKRIQPPYTPLYRELGSDLRLFWEYQVPAGAWVNLHRHATEEIWYVTAGEGTYVQDGEEQVIRAGDAIVIYPGSWHGMRADRGDFTFLVIDVGAAKMNQPH